MAMRSLLGAAAPGRASPGAVSPNAIGVGTTAPRKFRGQEKRAAALAPASTADAAMPPRGRASTWDTKYRTASGVSSTQQVGDAADGIPRYSRDTAIPALFANRRSRPRDPTALEVRITDVAAGKAWTCSSSVRHAARVPGTSSSIVFGLTR